MDRKLFFNRFWKLTAFLCALSLLAACAAETPTLTVPAATPFPAPEGLRIAVGTDTHFAPDNADHDPALGEVAYNPELLDALLWDARQQGAQCILLTGDLVNGGRPARYEALREKLRASEEAGLDVYVLPGNHDLGPIRQTDFAEYMKDFGYDEAYSRDPASLSYSIVRSGVMLLMMDTAGYGAGAVDLPGAEALSPNGSYLSPSTLGWVRVMLQEAKAQGLHVLPAGHFNLLPEISRRPDAEGYYLENGDRFAALLRAYHVPLYLSGHQHIRAVYQEDGLTELITEYLLAYPAGYTVLDLTEEGLRCLHRRADVDAWAAGTGQTDPVLRDFAAWELENQRSYAERTVNSMAARNPLTKREARDAAAFYFAVMEAFWNGELAARRPEMEAMPGYRPFFHAAQGFAYSWWFKELIENTSPLLGGFTLAWQSE